MAECNQLALLSLKGLTLYCIRSVYDGVNNDDVDESTDLSRMLRPTCVRFWLIVFQDFVTANTSFSVRGILIDVLNLSRLRCCPLSVVTVHTGLLGPRCIMSSPFGDTYILLIAHPTDNPILELLLLLLLLLMTRVTIEVQWRFCCNDNECRSWLVVHHSC